MKNFLKWLVLKIKIFSYLNKEIQKAKLIESMLKKEKLDNLDDFIK